MPIYGLSDRDSLDPRFKEIGRLRKGAAKKGNQPGADLEYFRFVPTGNRPDVLAAFQKAYGKEPTHLEVYFPFDTMERVFSSWREEYGQNRLCKLRCDGARWHDWVIGDRHYHSTEGRECDFEFRDSAAGCPKCPCGYYGRLSIILPEMWYAGHVGLVTVMTTSINDISILASKLVQWEPLTNKPFLLWRQLDRIGVPIGGKRAGVDKSLLHLELTEEKLVQAFLSAGDQPAQLAERATGAGDTEQPEAEPEDIEGDEGPDEAQFEEIEPEAAQATPGEFTDKAPEMDYMPEGIDTWGDRRWGRLYFEARNHLGFQDDAHVQRVLDRLYPEAEDKERMTYKGAWTLLVGYRRSTLEDEAAGAA